MNLYDTVIIGTSPASILEMAVLQKMGKKTLMIDSRPQVGGNWGTITLPTLGEVESGAHYIAPDQTLYDLLESVIGVQLAEVPNPRYFLPRRVFFSNSSPWLDRWGSGVAPEINKLPSSVKEFRSIVSPYLRYMESKIRSAGRPKVKMKYFSNGTSGLVESLQRFISDRKLEVRLNTMVCGAEVESKEGVVNVKTDHEDVRAKKLMITSCSRLQEVKVDGVCCYLPKIIRPLVQLHLVFKGPSIREFTFGQFVQSPYLLLATNLTPFLNKSAREGGFSLIASLVIETTSQNEDSVQKITELLKFYGIVHRDNILESYHWSQYDVPQLQDNELAKIEEDLGPYVGVLSTHSLGGDKLERWWSSLKPGR